MNKNIHEGHRNRLREFAYNNNFKNMPEHQILELLLSYVIPRKDTNPIAHRLIKEFGGFSAVIDADFNDLLKIDGIGNKTAHFLTTLKHLFYAYNAGRVNKNETILSTLDAVNFIKNILVGKTVEEFYVICLDSANKVKLCELINVGVVNKTDVDVRQIMEVVFKSKTANIIVCHNHPTGNSRPSAADDKLTKALLTTLTLNGLTLLDHIILSNEDYYSYNRNGVLQKYAQDVSNLISSPVVMQKPCKYN